MLIVLWFNYVFLSLQDEIMYDKLRGSVKKLQVVAEEVHMLGTEEAAAVVCVHTYIGICSKLEYQYGYAKHMIHHCM